MKLNSVYLEITNVCNLHCSFCPSSNLDVSHLGKNSRQFMEQELFQRCIANIQDVAENIYFHILGEPTLHPQFATYLKFLESTSLKLNLTTNGTTLESIGQTLLQSKSLRQVNISLHAYAEMEFTQAIRHLHNVMDFAQKALTECPELYINLRLWNVGDKASNTWNKQVLATIKEVFGTSISLDHFCSRHKSFLVAGRIYVHQDSRFEWPKEAPSTTIPRGSVPGTCRALDTHIGILHDGRVVACCLDYSGKITLGKIQEQNLNQILDSSFARNIKDGFERHQLRHPFCQSCTFCKRFK